MARSKEVERRIEAKNGLKTVMKAMKAFAGLNIRKTSALMRPIREYERDVKTAFGLMAGHLHAGRRAPSDDGGRIMVLFGSDLGLCGPFNERLAEFAAKAAREGDSVFVVGRKLKEKLDMAGFKYAASLGSVTTVEGVKSAMVESFSQIAKFYVGGPAAPLVFVFSRLSEKGDSVGVVEEEFLPPEPPPEPDREREREKPILYLPPERVVDEIVGELLYIRLYGCHMESLLAENWFRFQSMEGAIENLDSKIKELETLYNFSKQEEITEEIIEIIEGHSMGGPAGG